MKKYFLYLTTPLVIYFLLFPNKSKAQMVNRHIHVLRILDTNNRNPNVRDGCESIQYAMREEIDRVSKYLEIPQENINYYDVLGDKFRLNELEKILRYDIEYIDESDIVFLLYVGHGFKDRTSVVDVEFPMFFFGSEKRSISYDDVKYALLDENPSLLFSLVIACNQDLDPVTNEPPPFETVNSPPVYSGSSTSGTISIEPLVHKENYLTLFNDAPGYIRTVELLSAKRDNSTYMTRSGGIFFEEFLLQYYSYLEEEAFANRINWEDIAENTVRQTRIRSRMHHLPQDPFYSVSLTPKVLIEIPDKFTEKTSQRVKKGNKPLCELEIKELKKVHRSNLRDLRKEHNERIRAKRRERPKPSQLTRKTFRQELKAERARMKYIHNKTVERKEKECYGSKN